MSEAAPIVAMTPNEKRATAVVASVAMLRMIGLFSLLPVLSLYAAGLDGATPLLVGLAVGAYGLTQAGLQIPLGALSDRIGRLPVLLGGLALFAVGSAVAGFADSIHGVIVGRLLQGAGAISATLTALVADSTRVEVRTRSMAIFGIGFGLSFVVSVVFGPWFAARFGVPALFGFAVVAAVSAAALLLALPEGAERPDTPRRWEIRRALRPDLLRLDFYVFLLHAIVTASFVALPFLLRNGLELPLSAHWQLYVGTIAASLTGTIPLILKDERRGKNGTVAVAVGLLFAGQVALAFSGGSIVVVFLAVSVFFAGFNFLEAGLPAKLSALADDDTRGASLGVFATSQFLGVFTGGLLGGRLLDAGNPGNVFIACAVLAAFWLGLHAFSRPD